MEYPKEYLKLKKEAFMGWQTWNVRSVLSQVHMPDGLTLGLMLKEYQNGHVLPEALLGRQEEGAESIIPGVRTYDGSYTALVLQWEGISVRVESAALEDELIWLVTPLALKKAPVMLAAEASVLWNREGYAVHDGDRLLAHMPKGERKVYLTGEKWPFKPDPSLPAKGVYLTALLKEPVVVSTGRAYSSEEAAAIMERAKGELKKSQRAYGKNEALYEALQCALSWDTIYDPKNDRLISPVSRLWSLDRGGYVLFCWDNYFAGMMAGLGNRAIAYSNLIEITLERTEAGFVPNFIHGTGQKSEDRSQPPVGSAMLLAAYRRYREKWLVRFLYPYLLRWNGWFYEHRMTESGALAWGSDPYEPSLDNYWERAGVGETFGGALESGLDNSPMYDDIPFDEETHRMKLLDVGLTGLYIWDCRALEALAKEIGRTEDLGELQKRRQKAEKGLMGLWDEDFGFFCNKRTDTGEFSRRISPTGFYALFSDSVTKEQAERMAKEHYFNPESFYGEWMIPSISRKDPAFPEQDYWRGRIWAPMNFLCYLACKNKGLSEVTKDLSEKSAALLKKEWKAHGHIHENYNALTGSGCDRANSDRFYHWGALPALLPMIEQGQIKEFD